MYAIKFSHRYRKMPPDIERLWTFVENVVERDYADLAPEEIDEDTAIVGGGNYELPRGRLIVIDLYTQTPGGPFRWKTMRRWTWEKWAFYRSLRGQQVGIEIAY